MDGKLYEWVVLCKDREFVMSEKQYQLLMDNQEARFIQYDDFMVQPAMISWAFRREADALIKKYPCKECHGSKKRVVNGERVDCSSCKGQGFNVV